MSHHPEIHLEQQSSGQKTLQAYVTGLLLCVVLTFASFGLVEMHLLAGGPLYIALAGLAIVQLLVQCVCFLSLNGSREGQWNLLPFIFTIMIIGILVGGTLWIMYNLNYNMMN